MAIIKENRRKRKGKKALYLEHPDKMESQGRLPGRGLTLAQS